MNATFHVAGSRTKRPGNGVADGGMQMVSAGWGGALGEFGLVCVEFEVPVRHPHRCPVPEAWLQMEYFFLGFCGHYLHALQQSSRFLGAADPSSVCRRTPGLVKGSWGQICH